MEMQIEALELLPAPVDGLAACQAQSSCGKSCVVTCQRTCNFTGDPV